jgi:hypothetical protein
MKANGLRQEEFPGEILRYFGFEEEKKIMDPIGPSREARRACGII